MGKRSDFARVDKDQYDTPLEAIPPLLPHLAGIRSYAEPCYGAGSLAASLAKLVPDLELAWASDIAPRAPGVPQLDALDLGSRHIGGVDAIITNPPWRRDLLHPMIEHFWSFGVPVWLLIDSNWSHSLAATPFLALCRAEVMVGRLRWMPDTPYSAKDDTSWFLFDGDEDEAPVQFFPRQERIKRAQATR